MIIRKRERSKFKFTCSGWTVITEWLQDTGEGAELEAEREAEREAEQEAELERLLALTELTKTVR